MEPTDDDRVADLWIPEAELLGFLTGRTRITNLPADARFVAVNYSFARRLVVIRLQSKTFDLVGPVEMASRFDAETEPIPLDSITLNGRKYVLPYFIAETEPVTVNDFADTPTLEQVAPPTRPPQPKRNDHGTR